MALVVALFWMLAAGEALLSRGRWGTPSPPGAPCGVLVALGLRGVGERLRPREECSPGTVRGPSAEPFT